MRRCFARLGAVPGIAVAVGVAALLATGCSDRSRPELPDDDGGIRRRVFKPPPGRVRAVPPHNIHGEGIGPYQLGASLGQILNLLPHGPRVELFRLGSVADYSLVRSENGALLVGVERNAGVTFVAAIAPVVARTKGGAEVGTSTAALVGELGPPPNDATIRDPRLIRSATLPGAVFLIEDGRVAAIVVDRKTPKPDPEKRSAKADPEKPGCRPIGALGGKLLAAARLGTAATVKVLCEDAEIRAAVVAWGDRWVWLAVSGDKIRRAGAGSLDGLALAAPALIGGPPVLVAVTEERDDDQLVVRLEVIRIDKQATTVEKATLYRLSSSNMRLAGGAVSRAQIAVELEPAEESLTVRGLYTQRDRSGQLSVVAPLSSRDLELNSRPRKPPRATSDGDVDGGPRPSPDARRPSRAIGPR